MLRRLRGTIWPLALAGVALAFGVRSLDAQTPEGTTITNTAVVSFTDANGNSYTDVTASASVTVGFVAGVDVTGPVSAAPDTGSTGNTLSFDIQNVGNGTDAMVIDTAVSAAGIITITGYTYDGTTYTSLADLNTRLSQVADSVAQAATITIVVEYSVASGTGGQSVDFTLTATSGRDSNTSDAVTTSITPTETLGVAVTPDDDSETDRLPSNGTSYTGVFYVKNTGTGPEIFDLVAARGTGATAAIINISVASNTGSIAAGDSVQVNVTYSIADVNAGVVDTLFLTATSQTDGNVSDPGHITIRVVRPALTVTKAAFESDSATAVSGDVLPNEVIWYLVTVENTGTADAQSVQVADTLPSELTLISANGRTAGNWTMTTVDTVNGIVIADLDAALPATETRYVWIQARVN